MIKESITCYAAILHLNKGQNILKETYQGHPGYAPIFESVTQFPGRAEKTAKLKDLLGCSEDRSEWKANLPRLIFVSDMGDAMSSLSHFPFLKDDLIPAITSDAGKRHLWLWLTKRPLRLAEFAEQIGGFPDNVCAMTTLTSSNQENMKRLADLKKVQARIRGLSIEPLWERIDPKTLDLKGIDWVIVGGESGSGELTRPFALEWAEELRDHCRKNRVAFFCKQLGRKPTRNGEPVILKDSHGGNWDEWPNQELKIREFPKAFHNYRKTETKHLKKTKKMKIELPTPTDEEKADFERLDMVVKNGIKGYMEAGLALVEIHAKKLWRAGNHTTWEQYCKSVEGISKTQAHRLMQASECILELESEEPLEIRPENESQVRPLLRLENLGDRRAVWEAACHWAGDKDCSLTAKIVTRMVDALEAGEYQDGEVKPKRVPEVSKRAELLSNLRTAILEKSSWEEVERLFSELEKAI